MPAVMSRPRCPPMLWPLMLLDRAQVRSLWDDEGRPPSAFSFLASCSFRTGKTKIFTGASTRRSHHLNSIASLRSGSSLPIAEANAEARLPLASASRSFCSHARGGFQKNVITWHQCRLR